MKIFDTHCHYNMTPLYENWQERWKRAQEEGVDGSLVVGTAIETSKRAVEIASAEKNLYAAVGVHPNKYESVLPADLPTTLAAHQSVLSMLIREQKVVAIGETGLDYFRLEGDSTVAINNQKQAFRMHIQLATESKLPLIIHVRDKGEQAYWDVLELLKKEYPFGQPFVLHCISGPVEYLKQALELGAYIGVAGNVTYKNADPIRELIKLVPHDRLLSETDAPFLPPHPHRGQMCEPWMINLTVSYLEDEFKISPEQLAKNAVRVLLAE